MKRYTTIVIFIVISSISTATHLRNFDTIKADIFSKKAAMEYFDVEAQILSSGTKHLADKDWQKAQCVKFHRVIDLAEKAKKSAKRVISQEKASKKEVHAAQKSFDRATQVIFAVNSKWCFDYTCNISG